MSGVPVSVIVPTRDSAELMRSFLTSCLESDHPDFEVVVNDDERSTDDLEAVVTEFSAKGLDIRYLRLNVSMAQGRCSAVPHSRGEILVQLDSDMELTPGLLGECVERIRAGADALVIPEESFGSTFWARCKWLEKKCYEGEERIESARVFSRACYEAVGGHDPSMVFSEDKDLDIRVRRAGYTVGRTTAHLRHNEGYLTLRGTLRKKRGYAGTTDVFARTHPAHYAWQTNILHRYRLYLRHWRRALAHPVTYCGMVFLKTVEFGAGAVGLLAGRPRAGR